jgi:hypothetical protein
MSDVPMPDELESILVRLDDAFEQVLEPVPVRLSDAARQAFAWRLIDQQLATLIDDSSESELVGIRGTASDRRSFRFGAGDVVIRVHLTPDTLIVMLEPPLSIVCRVVTEQAASDHRTDELGELVIDAPQVPVRIEVDLPGGRFVTPWITG